MPWDWRTHGRFLAYRASCLTTGSQVMGWSMLRFINICLVLALVALAYVIYEGKYEARALDEDIDGLSKNIETEQDAVAELRAEWSVLNRPERIERLAQKHLKLAAARPAQLVTIDTVSASDLCGI